MELWRNMEPVGIRRTQRSKKTRNGKEELGWRGVPGKTVQCSGGKKGACKSDKVATGE